MKNTLTKVCLAVTTLLSVGLLAGFFISCIYEYPQLEIVDLRSEVSNSDDEDDDRRSDRRSNRYCEDRDSCQDICDDMFESVSSRKSCYESSNRDVDTLQEVFDVIADSSISKRNLESLDSEDFELFLSISDGTDSFIDIIKEEKPKPAGYEPEDARMVLEWIARNEDIASEIQDYDSGARLLIELMEIATTTTRNIRKATTSRTTSLNGDITSRDIISWRLDQGIYLLQIENLDCSPACETRYSLQEDIRPFLIGFLGWSDLIRYGGRDNESFIEYSDNDASKELAHSALVEKCQDATDEDDIEDEDVKRCVLAAYCTSDINFNTVLDDSPFNIDDSRDKACDYDQITDDSYVEDLF